MPKQFLIIKDKGPRLRQAIYHHTTLSTPAGTVMSDVVKPAERKQRPVLPGAIMY